MKCLTIKTQAKQEIIDITERLQRALRELGIQNGVVVLFVPHTTAAITINENADPAVKEDILTALGKLVPAGPHYKHAEGNAHAHIKASLIGHSVTVPVQEGKLHLGTWQGVLFCEFDGPRTRELWLTAFAI
ncbi:MAG: secondary thiamine-phosphate synthase enzyme YjbQ [Candidatus Bipolaricaulota bacterium]|nr:secondary thiamine-phosphate synthase enzyme YjbQ [Candidatus Bipolaricaulota bacterium]MDW8110598.1 secondary thiamine-phosphate synthase enzyme YjbQ [Candidatus Bipolaricaulota bacterium]MDW8329490.1 secondary thiamine-phosphate synthase enzyme YjbQ [Candidatus Bipolaricaulota bacterium]MDW8329997.1 secondary thiamine-phosphate synthase enzyme YjbQ [Candidatus Bipolaricaulota bacterium]